MQILRSRVTYHLGQTKLIICCCLDFLIKKLDQVTEKKSKVIKWEWLETIIEILHGFVHRYGVFYHKLQQNLPGTTLHEKRKKKILVIIVIL